MTASPVRLGLIALAALALAGCISLVPKSKAVHLYRFGQPVVAASDAGGEVAVFRASSGFQRGSGGDRLLTITGEKAAYVAETRWIAPATVLWDEAVLAAFDADPGPVRLISRGQPAQSTLLLRLDVRTFETRYDRGDKAAPVVVVRVRGVVMRTKEQVVLGERIFEAQARAGANRVSAIVPAYDRAVADVLKDIVDWTNAQATAG